MSASDVLIVPKTLAVGTDFHVENQIGPEDYNEPRLLSGGTDGDLLARDGASPTGATWTPLASLPLAPLVHTHSAADLVSGVLDVAQGGTGLTAYVTGDLIVAMGGGTLARFPASGPGQVLSSNGNGTPPVWNAWPSVTDLNLALAGKLTWGIDTQLWRDAANIVAQRNGTNPQLFRVYGTYTDAANYERATVGWLTGTECGIAAEWLGTGIPRNLTFRTGGTLRWYIHATAGYLYAGADNTYDIGATAANRPRSIYAGTSFRAPDGTPAAPSITFANSTGTGLSWLNASSALVGSLGGAAKWTLNAGTFGLGSAVVLGWSSNVDPTAASADVTLARDGAGVLALVRGLSQQTFRIYNTFTDASNYERGFLRWNANVFDLGTENAGTGTQRSVGIYTGGVRRWIVDSLGHLIGSTDNANDIGAAGANRPRNVFVAGAVCQRTKAGTPTDADVTTPTDGMVIVDTTASKVWVRIGGAWKGVVVT